MKYLRSKILVMVMISTLLSCSEKDKQVIRKFQEVFDENSEPFKESIDDKETILIIPRTGCSSCIGIADYLYKSNQYNIEKTFFIFTKVGSLKAIRIRDGIDLDQPNTYIDKDNNFSNGILNSLYPVILNMHKGKIVDLNYLTSHKTQLINSLNTD